MSATECGMLEREYEIARQNTIRMSRQLHDLKAENALLGEALWAAMELHRGPQFRTDAAITQYAEAVDALIDSGWKYEAQP